MALFKKLFKKNLAKKAVRTPSFLDRSSTPNTNQQPIRSVFPIQAMPGVSSPLVEMNGFGDEIASRPPTNFLTGGLPKQTLPVSQPPTAIGAPVPPPPSSIGRPTPPMSIGGPGGGIAIGRPVAPPTNIGRPLPPVSIGGPGGMRLYHP